MAKGTKLSEFEKGKIIALKTVRKSHREISKVLGCSKTVICNYLKSPNKYGTRKVQISMEQENRLVGQKNYRHNLREELFAK